MFRSLIALSFFVSVAARAAAERPADWISRMIPLTDTRPLGAVTQPAGCALELVELRYESPRPRAGAVLMAPGLFHDGFIFDLLPDEGISYARWLMREKGLQPFFFHARGEGRSCYPAQSNLDDIAIDDLPTAIRYLADQVERGKIYLFGHSQGAITLQAALAGLSRCELGLNCFRPEAGAALQTRVKGAALFAGSVAMSSSDHVHPLMKLALLDPLLTWPLMPLVDRIPASWLTVYLSPTEPGRGPASGDDSAAYWDIWEDVYHVENVNRKVRRAWYDRSLDASTMRILSQYARGLKHGGLTNSSFQLYAQHLGNIRVPTVTGAFGLDRISDPPSTERDTYARLGSARKRFVVFEGQGHDDLFMRADFHANQSELWDWLGANAD